jgi:hypothetical protein
MTIARPHTKGGVLGFLAALTFVIVLPQPSLPVVTGGGLLVLVGIAEHLADLEDAS